HEADQPFLPMLRPHQVLQRVDQQDKQLPWNASIHFDHSLYDILDDLEFLPNQDVTHEYLLQKLFLPQLLEYVRQPLVLLCPPSLRYELDEFDHLVQDFQVRDGLFHDGSDQIPIV